LLLGLLLDLRENLVAKAILYRILIRILLEPNDVCEQFLGRKVPAQAMFGSLCRNSIPSMILMELRQEDAIFMTEPGSLGLLFHSIDPVPNL
jgi:hypothetical protein